MHGLSRSYPTFIAHTGCRVEIRRTQSLDNELRWLLLIPADRATSNDLRSEFYTGLSVNPNFAH
jgi:hypothetical protein